MDRKNRPTAAPRMREARHPSNAEGKWSPEVSVQCGAPINISITHAEIAILRAFLSSEIDAIIIAEDL
jgi:hypothetical protein